MKTNKKNYPSVQFGTSLMLVVFMVLCLTAFATLSLSSALKNYSYSQKTAQKTTDYYQADAKASRKLEEIAGILKKAYLTSPESYPENALDSLSRIDNLKITKNVGENYPQVSFEIPVNESQALSVRLILNGTSSENGLFTISGWKEISTEEWNSNTTLPVIGSD